MQPTFELTSEALAAVSNSSGASVGQREIPVEAMYIIMNLGAWLGMVDRDEAQRAELAEGGGRWLASTERRQGAQACGPRSRAALPSPCCGPSARATSHALPPNPTCLPAPFRVPQA